MSTHFGIRHFLVVVISSALLMALSPSASLLAQYYSHFVYFPTVMNASNATFGDVIRTIRLPTSGAQGLAWDGTNLWMAWGDIYKLNPTDGSVLGQIPGPAGDIQDLTWDGSALWCVSYSTDRIYRLNPGSGQVLKSFPSPGSKPIGIAWDGTYLWHSDENGTFYKLRPSDGSVVSSVPSPFDNSTTLLDWDGRYLWASTDGRFWQFDTSNWQILKTIRVPARWSKGIAWDGENLWNGGFEDDRLYLVDATPAGATIGGRVLKNGSPVVGKKIEIFKNSNADNEMMVGRMTTNASGGYQFTVDPGVEYELRGFGDTLNNELMEWVWVERVPAAQSADFHAAVTLPDVDIWYGGLLTPAPGTTFNCDQVSAANPIHFSWSAKTDATSYRVRLVQHGNWGHHYWDSPSSPATAVNFDGTTNSGAHIPAMQYDWLVGMRLSNGWWVWGGPGMLNII